MDQLQLNSLGRAQLIGLLEQFEAKIQHDAEKRDAAIAKLRGRIEMYRGNYKAHGHDIALARLETAEVILADFTEGAP